MKSSPSRILLAGLLGTVAFTTVVYGGGLILFGRPVDIGTMLARLLGLAPFAGIMLQFLLGIIVLPGLFGLLALRRDPDVPVAKGLALGALLWVATEGGMVPATGGGRFHAGAGGVLATLLVLAAFLLYGFLLGWALTVRTRGHDMVKMQKEMGSVPWTDL
jgi:hypothetical protein